MSELFEATRDPDPRVRRAAVRELCPCAIKRNRDDVWARLLELTRDEDASVRSLVLHDLTDGSPRERAPAIRAALEVMRNDPDPRLRRRVRGVLAHERRTGRLNIE